MASPDSQHGRTPRPVRRWLVLGGVVALLVCGTFWLQTQPPSPAPDRPEPPPTPDPRLAYTGPYRNINPAVRYVGDAACTACHRLEAESYRKNPMGRSLTPVRDLLGQPPHDDLGGARFEALGSVFTVERRGERVFHRHTRQGAGKPVYSCELKADYVIGSGARGYSFLSDRDGYLYQTPVSWFSQKRVWDLSPGFTPRELPGRGVVPECLFCHANRANPRGDTLNGYDQPVFDGHAIGCERCHGPAELHVKERSADIVVRGPVDHTIVNPAKLEPILRESVCQQCHLAGTIRLPRRGRGLYDYRPGLPLQQFWAVFVPDRADGGNQKAVNHVEQMYLSRCFQGTSGANKLGCVSCHNPHEPVPAGQGVEYYRHRCLDCHQSKGCSRPREDRLRENKQDSCIDCHMPRYTASDIAHTAVTDHRIVRRPDPAPARQPEEVLDRFPIPFYREGMAQGDPELQRDLGIALARLAVNRKGDPQRFALRAVVLLDEHLRSHDNDVAAWEAQGQALIALGRLREALRAFERALERAPRRELSLFSAAMLAGEANLPEKTLGYWRRAVEVNPWEPDYRASLALRLAHEEEWGEAREQCRAWVRLDPGSADARRLLVRLLHQAGDWEEAAAEEALLRWLR